MRPEGISAGSYNHSDEDIPLDLVFFSPFEELRLNHGMKRNSQGILALALFPLSTSEGLRTSRGGRKDSLWEARLPVWRERRPPALLRALAHVVQALDDQQRLVRHIPLERRLEPHHQRAHVARAHRRRPDRFVHLLLLGNARGLCTRSAAFSRRSPHSARRCSLRSSSGLSYRASSKMMYGAQRSALVAYAVPQSQSSAAATGALALALVLVYGSSSYSLQWFVCDSSLAVTPFYSHCLFSRAKTFLLTFLLIQAPSTTTCALPPPSAHRSAFILRLAASTAPSTCALPVAARLQPAPCLHHLRLAASTPPSTCALHLRLTASTAPSTCALPVAAAPLLRHLTSPI
jgi:hypothetical protein